MLKGRGRDTRGVTSPTPGHPSIRSPILAAPGHPNARSPGLVATTPGHPTMRSPALASRPGQQRALPAKPEPDYEALSLSQLGEDRPPLPPKGTPPVPPPRRHKALSLSQLGEDRPPLPPKGTPPVPPPRRHKLSNSPMPPTTPLLDQRRATLGHAHAAMPGMRSSASPTIQHSPIHQPLHVQTKMVNNPSQMGSMPFLPTTMPHQHQQPMHMQQNASTLGHLNVGWNRPRGSLQGFSVPPQVQEPWESPEGIPPGMGQPQWGRPMRRGASTLELGGVNVACTGCAHGAPPTWRYGSCATLDQPWGVGQGGWPMQQCCPPQQSPHGHFHMHQHMPQTPQPYRRADSRAMSRAASRTGSRAASPALSVRSRASRRAKHRTPSPPLPSSDADSESESESEPAPKPRNDYPNSRPERPSSRSERPSSRSEPAEGELGPVPPPPAAAWQCEHCTYVNEPGVRVCVICCRTPTAAPKVVTEATVNFDRLNITSRPALERVEPQRVEQERTSKSKKERASTGSGPSPPREHYSPKITTQRLTTPAPDQNGQSRHDMAVGPSPPRETRSNHNSMAVGTSPARETRAIHNSTVVGRSPPRETRSNHNSATENSPRDGRDPYTNTEQHVERHSVSVGPSPPRDNNKQESATGQKKFVGTSPPRDVRPESRSSSIAGKINVSNTGTSPPPQSISTQTYDEPGAAGRARARRRLRDERRKRSHSRHSLSSDTRVSPHTAPTDIGTTSRVQQSGPVPGAGCATSGASDRTAATPCPAIQGVRTTGAWEWRERDSSPSVRGGEWGGKLARRASHLDLRRRDSRPARRTSLYGSEAPSPEPPSGARALSMEVLSGAGRGAERGLELARLLAEAERLGYSAAEAEPVRVSAEGRVRGRVWGSPAGADDEAAPRARAEDSSDEYDAPPPVQYPYLEDEWYPPIDASDGYEIDREIDLWSVPPPAPAPMAPLTRDTAEVALKLRSLLLQAGIPSIDENLLLKGLLSNGAPTTKLTPEPNAPLDFIQSENDFIDAYNALTRASPLPNISKPNKESESETISAESKAKEQHIKRDDETQRPDVKDRNKIINKISHHHQKHKHHTLKPNSQVSNLIETNQVITQEIKRSHIETEDAVQQIQRPQTDTEEKVHLNQIHSLNNEINKFTPVTTLVSQAINEKVTLPDPSNFQTVRQAEEKSSNLNEIVDNTQKLIQQMKEEINSDIHSLDDGQSQTSRSDHDTSSHDEQESSYSETDEDANNSSMTSDEKEMTSSSSEDDNNDDIQVLSAELINRTSSEDNEQFEEALDNLDIQIEDVKHANIEILDSIARSLQEDHTISIEVNKPNEQHNIKKADCHEIPVEANKAKEYNDSHNISVVVNAPKGNNFKREDFNNNMFVQVNSFDEIYEELNTSNVSKKPTPQKITSDNTLKETKVTESIPIVPKIRLTKYAMNESVLKVVSPTKVIILDNKEPTYKAIVENTEIHEEHNSIESEIEVIHEDVDIDSTNELINISENNQEIFEHVNNWNDNGSSEIMSNNTSEPTVTESTEVGVTASISSPSQPLNEQQNKGETKFENTSEKKSVEPSQNGIIVKRVSPEKTQANLTNDINSNKSSTTVKSNIPKPVRTTLNTKPKSDKSAPKLLVSKVPVRRGSLKQYHAPAPPKGHFGNVQSGHVKQLQSKIFNSKDSKPTKPQVTEIDVKPSTSTATLSKKSPAPQPPRKLEQKQLSPPKTSPPSEKSNNYFRETCRTEDEWTESDSDESQIIRQTSVEEATPAAPSAPPPVTLRCVSGNIIDLARRQARMLLAEGATETWEQAQLAIELVSRGAELPAALLAALECADLPAALAYLHQDCELCASRLPEHEVTF
ncbi:E3 ubiquitin-protein ligase RNF31 [Operophtera brumata]|uniref:E3 ubiquitin-protein ligase RNF31 n=1 Tax=Operophtera brumata TaxID=104452 RepID=A0A0L7L2U7_OPEBR|nr:E3 ubiquitin-protein ligase RNF31 [Operophtera brumata]